MHKQALACLLVPGTNCSRHTHLDCSLHVRCFCIQMNRPCWVPALCPGSPLCRHVGTPAVCFLCHLWFKKCCKRRHILEAFRFLNNVFKKSQRNYYACPLLSILLFSDQLIYCLVFKKSRKIQSS